MKLSIGAIALALLLPATTNAQVPALTFEGYSDIRTGGGDTAYMRGLTHRYVNGELRLLTLTHRQMLHEVRVSASISSTTATWEIPDEAWAKDFHGIWYEQAKERLWIVGTEDYTAEDRRAKVTLLALGADGAVTTLKTFYLSATQKRVYGGCAAVPGGLVARLGGAYVCGWGGYTSLLMNGGGASVGATMYALPDPDTIANGARVSVRTILDHAGSRGVRRTIPDNRYESDWQSPTRDGLGYQVWGDSYYNTGMWIGTHFVAVASLCEGECWYQNSTLHHSGRQFEVHVWDGATLGSSRTQRPVAMTELDLDRANTWSPEGNTPVGNVSGATFDASTSTVYMVGYPMGANDSGRIFRFRVGNGPLPPAR